MPKMDGKIVKPSEAATAGHCPECGVDLEGVNIQGHKRSHWPALNPNEPSHTTAIARARMLDGMHADRQKEATKTVAQSPAPNDDDPGGEE
jgi:hypothetical protein